MIRVHPNIAVLSGVTIGLIAGAAAYSGICSSVVASPTPFSVPKAPVSLTQVRAVPAKPARCEAGSKLERDVCVIHVVRTVVVPAATTALNASRGGSASSTRATPGTPQAPSRRATPSSRAMPATRQTPVVHTMSSTRETKPVEQAKDPAKHPVENVNHAAEQANENAKEAGEHASENAKEAGENAEHAGQP